MVLENILDEYPSATHDLTYRSSGVFPQVRRRPVRACPSNGREERPTGLGNAANDLSAPGA